MLTLVVFEQLQGRTCVHDIGMCDCGLLGDVIDTNVFRRVK